ncbi:UNVERIFIED_CONTAM: hypothetical protein ACS92_06885 [Bacillus cereus]
MMKSTSAAAATGTHTASSPSPKRCNRHRRPPRMAAIAMPHIRSAQEEQSGTYRMSASAGQSLLQHCI